MDSQEFLETENTDPKSLPATPADPVSSLAGKKMEFAVEKKIMQVNIGFSAVGVPFMNNYEDWE